MERTIVPVQTKGLNQSVNKQEKRTIACQLKLRDNTLLVYNGAQPRIVEQILREMMHSE
ncbi:hypothetical protein LOOC260_107230 [Paucilactobacillus hokkaidonensis JCM 18461]|uniref:Uncharacterized protein n=1 Tax=Paucilactobacillus hokkaidonensis JCM 18461 TaxID=1291742 RepID=A0A0A1GWN0_9LACO|nr:hypothetical protein [Paucilactobacillus hokkaidonensis]BAP85263.1 hypothetical protein LOOC260_107230 [Paucilactobacillus hokkaidonensis JCM 18461]